MNSDFSDFLGNGFARRLIWRLGRRLYMTARGDIPNDMRTNGELVLQDLVLRLIPDDQLLTIVDVGASEGDYTVEFFARAAATGRSAVRAFAYEPSRATFARLQARLDNVGLASRVTLSATALSDAPAELEFVAYGDGSAVDHLQYEGVELTASHGESVAVTTLDIDMKAREVAFIHLLKIDTEGFDFRVLSGAMAILLRGAVWIVQFEYNHRWLMTRSQLRDVFELITNTDYRLGKLGPRGITLIDQWHPELERYFEANYVLVRADVARTIGISVGAFDSANTLAIKHP